MLEQYPDCYEPYLRYAITTDFRNFEAFDEKRFALLLLVELHQADEVDEFAKKMVGFGAALGPRFDDRNFPYVGRTRYVTMRAGKQAVIDEAAVSVWIKYVSRVELSLPVKPSSLADFTKETVIKPRFTGAKELLIGVLDDGCPFAAAQFLTTAESGHPVTRVRGIWDQNKLKAPVTIDASHDFGRTPPDFLFGIEYLRDLSPADALNQIGLNDWIQMHSIPSHVIDEDGCYADAGFSTLARLVSHGAHVMDVFAGRTPTSSRVGPPTERRDPPSWKPGVDYASGADVVFVQFSEECIRDATGVWLKDYVVQGIEYIMSFAEPGVTERVIVTLSYGPTTGPHDGTELLENALNALITQFDGTQGKPKLEIVLAAGNAYFSEGHVRFARRTDTDPEHVEWTWRLPPDNSVLCFAEVWMETAFVSSDTEVTLTPPSGSPIYKPTPPPPPPPPGTILPPAGVEQPIVRGDSTMWRLQVEPTIVPPNPATDTETAEHGDWKIKITGIGVGAHVHAYVARSDPNMGVRTRAKRSYFVDPNWEQQHSADASCNYAAGEFDRDNSLINRFGTLNGIATADRARIHVAGGFVIANQRKSPYSSAGPARNAAPRRGPDVALPCDESYALGGILGGGNRSGAVFRLQGTSAAAPQLARHVVTPPIPPAHDVPGPQIEKFKRGGGNVDPP